MIRTVAATRYVAPLREGGSLPGIVEADDLGTYVCKFRGAGQGPKVLVAEVVVGELARRLGIATPELVVVELDEAIGKYEADEEVQDLLTASIGSNLGVDFLPGSFGFDSACTPDAVPAGEVYEEIWSNPPIRIGKEALHALLLRWLPRLAPGGRAVLVVGKNLGADSLQRWLGEQGWPTERLASAKGFRVLEVRRG